jgi:hypothetical protein
MGYNNNNNHSRLLSLWNLKIMKDTLRLLSFHLRMLPCAATIACTFGNNRGLHARASNLINKSEPESQLQTRIKPLSYDSVRHIRRQNTHTTGGAGLEPAARKHVVATYLTARPSIRVRVVEFYRGKRRGISPQGGGLDNRLRINQPHSQAHPEERGSDRGMGWGRRRLVGEMFFTAPSPGGEGSLSETILDKDFGTGIRDLSKKIGLGCGPEIRLETTSQRQETTLDGGSIDRIFKDSEQDTLEYI